jgi:exopolysaccharide biosynthesis polyprenyl glycosylphosphotransferase
LVKDEARSYISDLEIVYNSKLPIIKTEFLVKKRPIQQKIKRFMDFTLSLTAIAVLSPLLLLLAAVINITSKGSAVFKQERVGLNEKIFYMYKFRSMVIDAEEQFEKVKTLNQTNSIMFKAKHDPRITPIGKFIRKYSLDELPQLFNVLKGEMSLVGPRPPLPRELKHYDRWHHVKFLGKPGLTGLWQVSGRANIKEFNDVIALDFSYIRNWSLLMDIKIILKTIPVVISADGAD